MQIVTDRKGAFGRYRSMGGVTFGSRTMAEIWRAIGGPAIAKEMADLIEPLTARVLEWNQKVLKESGLSALDAAAAERTGLGIPIILAVAAFELATGIIASGNADKEKKRLGFVENAFNVVQPPIQEESGRAIILLAEAGEPDAIGVLTAEEEGEAGPDVSDEFVEEATPASNTALLVAGAGAAAAAAAALTFLRGLKRPRRNRRRGLGISFSIPSSFLRQIQEQQEQRVTARQAEFDALTKGNPGGSFDPLPIWNADVAGIGEIQALKRVAIKLGVANNMLENTLSRLRDLGMPLKAPTTNGMGGRMGRYRRRRMGFVPSSRRGLGQTSGQLAEEFIEQNRASTLSSLRVMNDASSSAFDEAANRLDQGLNGNAQRDLDWASDISRWSGLGIILFSTGQIEDVSVPFYESMTKRLKRHAVVVLRNQAAIFRAQGDPESAAIADEVLQVFKNMESLATSAARGGLSGRGRMGAIFLASLILAAILTIAITTVAVAGPFLSERQQRATIEANEVRIREALIRKIVEAGERGDTKTVKALTKILQGEQKPIGMLQSASTLLKTITTLLVVGTGVFVGFRFVFPALRRQFGNNDRRPAAAPAQETRTFEQRAGGETRGQRKRRRKEERRRERGLTEAAAQRL